MTLRPTRRGFNAGVAGLLALGTGNAHAQAVEDTGLTLIIMGDLHSGYAWSARLLAAVRSAAAEARGEVRIVVNGDVFEHNNVVTRRSDGAIDFALIRAFVQIAPTIVTIGNHDSDLFDPRVFAHRIAATGATLLTDVVDPRTGQTYGARATRWRIGRHTVAVAALGTPVLALYPVAYRPFYQVPVPARYAADSLPILLDGADLSIALVHAGFLADRTVLPHLDGAFILHGAHDHLRFSQPVGRGVHLQSGAWSSAFQRVEIHFEAAGPVIAVHDQVLDAGAPADPRLQKAIDAGMRRHLLPADRRVLGVLPAALPLDQAVPRAAEWVRVAAGADLGLLSHTTFGDGLPAGPVSAYDLASFMRFDGPIAVGDIPRARLPALMARTNQFDGCTPYDRRIGDYLYATTSPDGTGDVVRVAINAYAVSSARNRIDLLGWDAPGFAPSRTAAGPLMLGDVLAHGLSAT